MKARDLIALLSQLDPETNVVLAEAGNDAATYNHATLEKALFSDFGEMHTGTTLEQFAEEFGDDAAAEVKEEWTLLLSWQS